MLSQAPSWSSTMTELTVRIVVALAAVVVAFGVAAGFRIRERMKAQRGLLDLTSLESAITLFSDVGCRTCDGARAALESAGIDFEEFRHDHHPEVFARVGVTAVPLIVRRGADGAEVFRIAGAVTSSGLRGLIRAG